MANQFTEDVQLLRELDKLIETTERSANTSSSPLAKELAGALFPGLDKLIPLGEKMENAKLAVLTRLRERFGELVEKEYE